MVASARQRGCGREAGGGAIATWHLHASSTGKLELDRWVHQMSEKQVIEAVLAEAVKTVFEGT
jgi:magnesium chelatase subunit I